MALSVAKILNNTHYGKAYIRYRKNKNKMYKKQNFWIWKPTSLVGLVVRICKYLGGACGKETTGATDQHQKEHCINRLGDGEEQWDGEIWIARLCLQE